VAASFVNAGFRGAAMAMPRADWAASAEATELAVSPSSRRRDQVAKPRAYAQGGVPLYLLIDQLADPATVTLFSDPAETSYRRL
jgi:hypothetical protein